MFRHRGCHSQGDFYNKRIQVQRAKLGTASHLLACLKHYKFNKLKKYYVVILNPCESEPLQVQSVYIPYMQYTSIYKWAC